MLAEFGDDPDCYTDAKSRKNYAGTSPMTQAFSALNTSPGARAYYDQLKAQGTEHNATLRQLANRLVGILHGCLKTRTCYDEVACLARMARQAVTVS